MKIILRIILTVALLAFSLATPIFAGSATWPSSPGSGDWNTASNWSPATVPNGASDTATFATSSKTAVSLSNATQVSAITFNSGASPFTITLPASTLALSFTISGVGITNNSGVTQNFVADYDSSSSEIEYMQFLNSATAGSSTTYSVRNGAFLSFYNASSAGNATFTVTGNPTTNYGSTIRFLDTSTAESGTFTVNALAAAQFYNGSTAANGAFVANGGGVQFTDGTTAGNAMLTANGATGSSGVVGGFAFYSSSSAGAATVIANGGTNGGHGSRIDFQDDSSGGTARVAVLGNGAGDVTNATLWIGAHNSPGVTIGSLEGNGNVYLGANNLTIGSNNASTIFSGLVYDLGAQGSGSLTKIGKGKLTVSKASGNSYTRGTTINKGTLIAKNTTGSATGTGAVQVNSGTLSGTGKIAGAVTVGNGTTAGAILQGGVGTKAGTLTVNNTLRFNSTSKYKCYLNRTATPKAGNVNAVGVTINANVPFTFLETGTAALSSGTIFTVINNTSANPISGRFSNLAAGSTFTDSNGTTFKASYSGGTGNDLTLTVQ